MQSNQRELSDSGDLTWHYPSKRVVRLKVAWGAFSVGLIIRRLGTSLIPCRIDRRSYFCFSALPTRGDSFAAVHVSMIGIAILRTIPCTASAR